MFRLVVLNGCVKLAGHKKQNKKETYPLVCVSFVPFSAETKILAGSVTKKFWPK